MSDFDLDLAALEEMRTKPKGAKRSPSWEPLQLSSLYPGTYLAADPSILAFGLVLFEVAPDQRYAVHMAEQFVTREGDVAGHEDTLRRTETIQSLIECWLRQWVVDHDWGTVRAVHEAPPMGGLSRSKFEISLITGYAYRAALKNVYREQGGIAMLPMVRRQDHAKLVCGDGNADKKIHHAALKEHFDAIRGADELITNAAKRDALSVALTAAKRGF